MDGGYDFEPVAVFQAVGDLAERPQHVQGVDRARTAREGIDCDNGSRFGLWSAAGAVPSAVFGVGRLTPGYSWPARAARVDRTMTAGLSGRDLSDAGGLGASGFGGRRRSSCGGPIAIHRWYRVRPRRSPVHSSAPGPVRRGGTGDQSMVSRSMRDLLPCSDAARQFAHGWPPGLGHRYWCSRSRRRVRGCRARVRRPADPASPTTARTDRTRQGGRREGDERRRAQVSRVYVSYWIDDAGMLQLWCTNKSQFPVYSVTTFWIRDGAVVEQQPARRALQLLPHEHIDVATGISSSDLGWMRSIESGATVAAADLTDTDRRRWRITSTGQIEQAPATPPSHGSGTDADLPQRWRTVIPKSVS